MTDIIPISTVWDVAPAQGCYLMPADAYHAAPGVSQSMLRQLSRSPAHLQAYLAEKREPTPAMEFGTLVHSVLFESAEEGVNYWVKPENYDGRTKEGRAWLADRAGKLLPVLTFDEGMALGGIKASVLAHHYGSGLLGAPGVSEVSVFVDQPCQDRPSHAIPCKGRLDRIVRADDGRVYIVDAKTTEDASPEGFRRTIERMEYHRQAAYYMDLLGNFVEVEDFIFLAVEKAPPYAVGVYRLDPEDITAGRRLYQRELALYEECSRKDKWPGYSQAIVTLALKPWAAGKEGAK